MTTEFKEIAEQTKFYSELIVALAGAIALIWVFTKRAYNFLLRVTKPLRNRESEENPRLKPTPLTAFSISLILISPLVMAFIHLTHASYATGAVWAMIQLLVVIVLLIVNGQPLKGGDALILLYLNGIFTSSLYANVVTAAAERNWEMAHGFLKLTRDNLDQAKTNARLFYEIRELRMTSLDQAKTNIKILDILAEQGKGPNTKARNPVDDSAMQALKAKP